MYPYIAVSISGLSFACKISICLLHSRREVMLGQTIVDMQPVLDLHDLIIRTFNFLIRISTIKKRFYKLYINFMYLEISHLVDNYLIAFNFIYRSKIVEIYRGPFIR